MACAICDNVYEKNIIFENDKMMIMSAIDPSASGHMQIFPKEHYAIMEEIPAELLGYMGVAANKISMLLFELLKVHGTNIIIQNGVPSGQSIPHTSIHIIPRRTDDGLKLDWDMKQASPESLDSIHRILSEGIVPEQNPIVLDKPKAVLKISDNTDDAPAQGQDDAAAGSSAPQDKGQDQPDEPEEEEPKKVNYYLKSLERIP